jgi:putative chitinase
MITIELLRAMGASKERAQIYAPHLISAAAEFEIVEPLDTAHWLAQIFQESGALHYVRELWDGKGQQAKYDTRTDLGNTPEVDGDGYHNRGVGLIQTTGEYNIERALKKLGYPPNSNDNLASPEGASRSAAYFWKSNELTAIAMSSGTDVGRCTKKVNGGYTHLAKRQAYFDKAWSYLSGIAQAPQPLTKPIDTSHEPVKPALKAVSSAGTVAQKPTFNVSKPNRSDYL